MTDLRTAAQQALEAMQSVNHATYAWACVEAIDALRAALAEPQTWVCPDSPVHRYNKPGHCEDCGKTLVQVVEPVQEPVVWAGCGECDCSFPCHKGEARCLRLPPRKPHEFIGLDLEEMDEIIDGNIKITDSRLRDAVYAVVIDTVTTLMEKNSG